MCTKKKAFCFLHLLCFQCFTAFKTFNPPYYIKIEKSVGSFNLAIGQKWVRKIEKKDNGY